MPSLSNRRSYTFDDLLQLKDAGAITADAAATVDGAAKIIDVGSASFEGVVVFDVTAIDIASGNERYVLALQGSTSSTFASVIENLACLDLGHTSVRAGGADTSTVGRFELPFVNVQDDVVYPYLRLYTDVTGTTPSINYTAFIGKKL